MGFLDFLRGPNMDSGLTQYRQTPGALLLDVRTPEEYAEGHIPGAQNLPLQSLQGIAAVAPAKAPPSLFTVTAVPGASRPPAFCSGWATPM